MFVFDWSANGNRAAIDQIIKEASVEARAAGEVTSQRLIDWVKKQKPLTEEAAMTYSKVVSALFVGHFVKAFFVGFAGESQESGEDYLKVLNSALTDCLDPLKERFGLAVELRIVRKA